MRLLPRKWPVVLFLLLPVIPLWKCVFLGHTVGAFDQIRQMAPWFGPRPDQPWDVLQADSVLQFYPWRDLVLDAWGKGQLPLWNHYQLAGAPLLANSQSAGFYPPHIFLGILHVPTPLAMVLLAWFHLTMAGLGTYSLCRKLGATRAAATFGGASFAMSAFMLSWTALPSVISTVAWIPWILAGVWSACKLGKPRHAPLVALGTAMMILAGHLQFVAYGLLAAAVFALLCLAVPRDKEESVERKPLRAAIGIVGALLVGGAIAAPQLLPVLEYSKFSHRRNTPTEEGYQAYVASAIKPFELLTLPLATLQGNPREFSERDPSLSEYWPQYVKQGANFAEAAVGIGPLLLTLLVLAPWRDRRLWPIAALGIVALLLALGTPLNKLLYFYAPGWSSTGSPGRVIVLFLLAASVMAAVSLSKERPDPQGLKGLLTWFLPAILVLPFVYFLAMSDFAPEGVDAREFKALVMSSFVSAAPWLLVAVVAAAIAITVKQKWVPIAAAAVIALPYATSIVMTGKPLAAPNMPGRSPYERYAFTNEPWGLREAAPAIMPPNTASIFRIHDIGGYDSLLHRDTVKLLHEISGQDSAPLANGNMMFVKPSATVEKLRESGVEWLVKPLETNIEFESLTSERVAGGEILSESFDGITLRATGGALVIRDRHMPGWTASIEGKPVEIKGDLWREVEVPSGEHQVKMTYEPPGLKTGFIMGLLGILAFVVGTFVPSRKKQTTDPDLAS